ncbi:isoprenyl transferase [Microbacterium sp. gxy059]|uniref:isoprenyl transferase n=1 Tax=Microbacterium sp. gxy059 TaxID=2957199 RepID=UPI003D97F6E8
MTHPYTHPDAEPLKPLNWTGIEPPVFAGAVPNHVAIVMDGNGRWANSQGLPRTEGHRIGVDAMLDTIAGAVQAGVRNLSVYAFSTENWKRSPAEVRFLMGFNREVLHKHRDQLNAWGVRVVWAGRQPKLWGSVIKDLRVAEELTKDNTTMTLAMCINYGGRWEIVDAMRRMAEDVQAGRLKPSAITEKTIARSLYVPSMPDVDLFIRSGGEQRTSNFMLWESAYAEMVFDDALWPEFSRVNLWNAIRAFHSRDRRYGGAIDRASSSS